MRILRRIFGRLPLLALLVSSAHIAAAQNDNSTVAVAPQYDSIHVYVAPSDFDKFVASFKATFGGTVTPRSLVTVTPTASKTLWQIVQTPYGIISVFGYETPAPYPFGLERTGYLVQDMDSAISAAHANGADVLVTPFPDPIGKDAIIQWPGGVNMQLYWHTVKPSYPKFEKVPENRVYISPDCADAFVHSFLGFSNGKVVTDDAAAPGIEIGRPSESFRRIRLESAFGKLTLFVTDGHLPYPYGWETTGYEVKNLAETVAKAKKAGVQVLVAPFRTGDRESAILDFPGGYIAEVHKALS